MFGLLDPSVAKVAAKAKAAYVPTHHHHGGLLDWVQHNLHSSMPTLFGKSQCVQRAYSDCMMKAPRPDRHTECMKWAIEKCRHEYPPHAVKAAYQQNHMHAANKVAYRQNHTDGDVKLALNKVGYPPVLYKMGYPVPIGDGLTVQKVPLPDGQGAATIYANGTDHCLRFTPIGYGSHGEVWGTDYGMANARTEYFLDAHSKHIFYFASGNDQLTFAARGVHLCCACR